MSRSFCLFGAVTLSLSITGCATIMDGSTQDILVDSSPQGARVEVNGASKGVTPASVTMLRKTSVPLVIKLDGYKDATITPTTKTNSMFWGNILLGGVFGSTTDSASGSINEYSPGSYFVTLDPESGPSRFTYGMHTDPDDVAKTKAFILTSYDQLAENIAVGAGSYLATLYSLLEIEADEQSVALEKLRALMTLHQSIVDFSDGVLSHFGKV